MRRLVLLTGVLLVAVTLMYGCGSKSKNSATPAAKAQASLGSKENPIKMAMVPSLDTQKLIASGEKLAELLNKETGLFYEVSVPTDYKSVVIAMGSGNIDVGWLSPLPYVIAHDRYGVEPILTTVRDKSTKYWSFIIVRNDSGINKLEDLKGKRFAYGDPMSTSGSLYAKDLIRRSGYDPKGFFTQELYAGAHDKVVMAVYNNQVDGGAIYGGVVSDAREKTANILKDVTSKTRVIARSADIPNDTVSIRKGLPADVVKKITDGLMSVSKSDEGRVAVMELYGIDGFVLAKDSDYDSVRKVAKDENIKLEQFQESKKK